MALRTSGLASDADAAQQIVSDQANEEGDDQQHRQDADDRGQCRQSECIKAQITTELRIGCTEGTTVDPQHEGTPGALAQNAGHHTDSERYPQHQRTNAGLDCCTVNGHRRIRVTEGGKPSIFITAAPREESSSPRDRGTNEAEDHKQRDARQDGLREHTAVVQFTEPTEICVHPHQHRNEEEQHGYDRHDGHELI